MDDQELEKLKKIMEENEKEEQKFNDELEKIRENAIIELSNWWGLRSPGYAGTIITKNKEVYSYKNQSIITAELEFENDSFITKKKELNIDEYNKVINFIENEIVDIECSDKRMFDAGFDVTINYNGTEKTVKNDEEIYKKAEQLINELLK